MVDGKFNRNEHGDLVWVPKLYPCSFNYTVPHAQVTKFWTKYEVERMRKQTVYFMILFGHLPKVTTSNHNTAGFPFESPKVSATLLPNWSQYMCDRGGQGGTETGFSPSTLVSLSGPLCQFSVLSFVTNTIQCHQMTATLNEPLTNTDCTKQCRFSASQMDSYNDSHTTGLL